VSQRVREGGESKSLDCTTNGKTRQQEFLPTRRGSAVQEENTPDGSAFLGISQRGLRMILAFRTAVGNVAQEWLIGIDVHRELCYTMAR
jgi:hypothetical protein